MHYPIVGAILALALQATTNACPTPGGPWRRTDVYETSHSDEPLETGDEQQQQALRCDAASFRGILPAGATLEKVQSVREGGSYGEGTANLPNPVNPTGLPALCAVTVRVGSSPTSSYRFGLFLPTAWKGKFLAVGNGGFGGGINWLDMAPGPHYGAATVSTDTGHSSIATDASWALNRPERKADWGWRAMHGSVTLGKQLTEAYYGRNISYSYYNGCSTGGRQGMREMQEFPDSFDGVLVGAPAWFPGVLNNYITKLGMYNLPSGPGNPKHVPTNLLTVLSKEVVKQCDKADGVADGIVSSPELCQFDINKLLCGRNGNNNSSTCLTKPQAETVMKVYGDYRSNDNGTLLYPGLTLSSEDQWWVVVGGQTDPSPFGTGYQRYLLLDDPTWDWRDYNESLIDLAKAKNPGNAVAANFDLSPFRARGGKMILYHGLSDGLVPTKGSQWYYNQTLTTMAPPGSDPKALQDFFRFFLIPGMQHCWTTASDAPWNVGAAYQAGVLGADQWSVPGFRDSKHDVVLALMDWVEKGKPVDSVVATTWRSPMNVTSGVLRQRPLCPWPGKAVYDGKGDVDEAKSWRCSS